MPSHSFVICRKLISDAVYLAWLSVRQQFNMCNIGILLWKWKEICSVGLLTNLDLHFRFERERTCPLCRAMVKPADLKSFGDGSTSLFFQLF